MMMTPLCAYPFTFQPPLLHRPLLQKPDLWHWEPIAGAVAPDGPQSDC